MSRHSQPPDPGGATQEVVDRMNAAMRDQAGYGFAEAPQDGRAARAILNDMVHDHRRRADGLKALLDALPARMPKEADQALATLLSEGRRRF